MIHFITKRFRNKGDPLPVRCFHGVADLRKHKEKMMTFDPIKAYVKRGRMVGAMSGGVKKFSEELKEEVQTRMSGWMLGGVYKNKGRLPVFSSWSRMPWREKFEFFSEFRQGERFYYSQVVSTNMVIQNHVEAGELEAARILFDEMPVRTVVSWNTMISGYSKWGRFCEALGLASIMHCSHVGLDKTTFSALLSVCAHSKSIGAGKQVHCLALKSGSEDFKFVGSSLLYFYANCFHIKEAKQVFDELYGRNELLWGLMLVDYVQCNMLTDAVDVFMKMPVRDVVAWTTLISGYAKSENGCEKALELFGWMRSSSEVLPNEWTLDCVIRVCDRLKLLHTGMTTHGLVMKFGYEFDDPICGALIDFYCNCEVLHNAIEVYKTRGKGGSYVSSSLIEGLILTGRFEEARKILGELENGNSTSYSMLIKWYAMCGQVEKSKELYGKMSPNNIMSANTMISVYSRNGELEKALDLFEETKGKRNPVTWNSMMSGLILNHKHEEALELYLTMRRQSIDQNRSTFSVLFHACTCVGSLHQGLLLHAQLTKTPYASNVYVGTALVDMYSKCGNISDAKTAFMYIPSPNVAAWTALINGYAYHGLGFEAILHFQSMLAQGVIPNGATFVGVLSACGRTGLVEEGMRIFHSMESTHRVTPTLEHYTCVLDLLGRSGHLKEAEKFIKEMPIEKDKIIWGALLNACWFWRDIELGERIAEKFISLEPKSTVPYVVLSNIYAGSGKWGEKMKARKKLKNLEVKKSPGCSWIELDSKVHTFSIEDKSHPHSNIIYSILEHIAVTVNSTVGFDSFHARTLA